MERQDSNNWSDLDSEESDRPRSTNETSKRLPERKRPLFNLGVIYSRQAEAEPVLKQSILQERERSAPETALGVARGSAELPGTRLPNPIEQAALQQTMRPPEIVGEDDEDEEPEETAKDKPAMPKRLRPPLPFGNRPEATPSAPYAEPSRPSPQAGTVYPISAEQATYVAPTAENPSVFAPQAAVEQTTAAPPRVAEYTPTAAIGGNQLPPPPPTERMTTPQPEPEDWGGEPSPLHREQTYNVYPSGSNPSEYVTKRSFENAQEDFRRKMAARMIVVATLSWYLARRPVKPLREQVSTLQEASKEWDEQRTQLTYEQREAQKRIAEQNRQIEQFTRPQSTPFRPEQMPTHRPQPVEALQPAEQQRVIGDNGEEIILQPGQRLVRNGVYSEVVDKYNHVVQNAIQHGKEYQLDRMRERAPSPFGAQDARFTPGGTGGAGGVGQPVAGPTGAPILPSGQTAVDHRLPMDDTGQTPNEEAQRLLNAPKPNPVVAAIISPWLWLAVGILLIAFFAAATI